MSTRLSRKQLKDIRSQAKANRKSLKLLKQKMKKHMRLNKKCLMQKEIKWASRKKKG